MSWFSSSIEFKNGTIINRLNKAELSWYNFVLISGRLLHAKINVHLFLKLNGALNNFLAVILSFELTKPFIFPKSLNPSSGNSEYVFNNFPNNSAQYLSSVSFCNGIWLQFSSPTM